MASTTENMSLRNATFTLSVNVMLFTLKVFLLLEVDSHYCFGQGIPTCLLKAIFV